MAAAHCILLKEWEGAYFGGLGKAVMYLDLDCRFDVLRLARILKNRIAEGCGKLHHFRVSLKLLFKRYASFCTFNLFWCLSQKHLFMVKESQQQMTFKGILQNTC